MPSSVNMAQKRCVILGAGFGGLVTAIRLARRQPLLEVVLIDRREEHVYTPWLYDVATNLLIGSTKRGLRTLRKTSAFSVRDILRTHKRKNLRFRQAEVVGVDTKAKQVQMEDGKTLAYDALVVGIGSEVNYFGISGLEKYARPLKRIDDAMQVREALQKALDALREDPTATRSVVVVGAGPTGVELSAELANFLQDCRRAGEAYCGRLRVVLIDAGPSCLSMFSPFLQEVASKRLSALGVHMQANTFLKRVRETHIFVTEGKSKEQQKVPYSILIWAGGIQPNRLLSKLSFPLSERGRIRVKEDLQIEGEKGVFALGDCAAFTDRQDRTLPPTAWAAEFEALHLAKNIERFFHKEPLKAFQPPVHWPAIITTGGKRAVGDLFGWKVSGFLAFVLRRIVDLRYFLLIFPFFYGLRVWKKGALFLAQND